MQLLETSTGPVAYDEQGAGHPIVLLPSGAHDHHDYDELRALLPAALPHGQPRLAGARRFACGPGSSARAMRFADIAELLVAAACPRRCGRRRQLGRRLRGARLAIRRPELVKGLVIIDGGGFSGRPPHLRAFCALMGRRWFLRAIYPGFATLYMRPKTEADRRARDTGVATTRRDPGLQAVTELWRSFASPEHDLCSAAPSITAPTLVIWGRRDPVIPVKVGRRITSTIPGARLVELDTGHVPFTTDPGGVAAQLIPFADAAFGEVTAAAAA